LNPTSLSVFFALPSCLGKLPKHQRWALDWTGSGLWRICWNWIESGL